MVDRTPRKRYTVPPKPMRSPQVRDKGAERMLTVDDVAEQIGATHDTVRRWLREGRIKGAMPGGRRIGWRIPQSELRRLLEPKRHGVEAEE